MGKKRTYIVRENSTIRRDGETYHPGDKIKLTHDDLINRKLWRDVIIRNSQERRDIKKQLHQSYKKGREKVLRKKARRMGALRNPDEVVDKYLEGDVQ